MNNLLKSGLILGSLVASQATLHAYNYEDDILKIVDGRCGRCHLNGNSKGGLAMDTDVIQDAVGPGGVVMPGSLTGSELMKRILMEETDEDRMPPKGKGLSESEIRKIKEWIEAGAPITEEDEEKMASEKPAEEEGSIMAKRPEPVTGDWTNTDGKTITATLLRVEGDKAILRYNGRDLPYPIAKLNEESQARIKAFVEAGE